MLTRRCSPLLVALVASLTLSAPGRADTPAGARGFTVEILVDGRPVPQYLARGTRYVEALKGREYAIRLRNPLGVRVAVALSVDGLNTIDAQRTTAAGARKWVLGPYETVTISGWQTSGDSARRFYFTTEERSYAQWLGRPEDAGVISAVFYRERVPEPPAVTQMLPSVGGGEAGRDQGAPRPAPAAPLAAAPQAGSAARREAAQESDYAATGIGREVRHNVQQVWLDLERAPAASVDLRYEYRPQLVRLGVLADAPPADRLSRRERARGFDGYCPAPPR